MSVTSVDATSPGFVSQPPPVAKPPVSGGVAATASASNVDCEAIRREAPNLFNSPISPRAFSAVLGAEAGAVVGITAAGVGVVAASLLALPALPIVAIGIGLGVAGAAVGAAVGWFGSKNVADCG